MRTLLFAVSVAFTAASFAPSVLADGAEQPESLTLTCERQTWDVGAVKIMRVTNHTGIDVKDGSLLVIDASDGDHQAIRGPAIPAQGSAGAAIPGNKKDPGSYTCTARAVAPGHWQ